MPALGSPLVRHVRRLAAAYDAYPGPSRDPNEVLDWYARHGPPGVAAEPISRREFLRRSAIVGSGAVAASALAWRGARPAAAGAQPTVAIVGAGLAGLSCAYRLHRHGIPSTVYEAQQRIGGRCWSIREFAHGQTAEHGGQYIDSRHRHIRSLANELGVGLVDTFEQSFPIGSQGFFWLDGALRDPGDVFADFGLFLDRLRADRRRVGPYDYAKAGPEAIEFDNLIMTDWFDQNLPGGSDSLLGHALRVFNQSFFGLDPEDMSSINLFEFFVPFTPYPGADERFRVAGGNDRIVAALDEALPPGTVKRGRALEAIWERGDGRIGLSLTGTAADVVADQVVLALPFTTLRDADTSGLPLSRRRRRAIRTLLMGTNAKLNMQFERSFAHFGWDAGFVSDVPHYVTWDSTYGQSDPAPRRPVLTIYNGGTDGATYPTDQAHGPAPAGIVQTALANLERGVDDLASAYSGLAFLDSWVDDPWVHGSYAGWGPGQYTDFWRFLGTPEGAVHFAGEHTSTHSQGYLNGGVESGERAAREVMIALG